MNVEKVPCPKCGYIMTLPFEHRCPMCIEKHPIELPVNKDLLLGKGRAK